MTSSQTTIDSSETSCSSTNIIGIQSSGDDSLATTESTDPMNVDHEQAHDSFETRSAREKSSSESSMSSDGSLKSLQDFEESILNSRVSDHMASNIDFVFNEEFCEDI